MQRIWHKAEKLMDWENFSFHYCSIRYLNHSSFHHNIIFIKKYFIQQSPKSHVLSMKILHKFVYFIYFYRGQLSPARKLSLISAFVIEGTLIPWQTARLIFICLYRHVDLDIAKFFEPLIRL